MPNSDSSESTSVAEDATGSPTFRDGPYGDSPTAITYQYQAPFYRELLFKRLAKARANAKFALPLSLQGFCVYLDFLERDIRIMDLRWMSYMLATVHHETGGTFRPIDEKGRGVTKTRIGPYHWPVKVAKQSDGSALVTEQDGDQWRVSLSGKFEARARTGQAAASIKQGATGVTHPAYTAAPGCPQQYYGRGYVQLTWWQNYVEAGLKTGAGLLYLFEPERVKEPARAYQIMSLGMIKGCIFAQAKHRLSRYFYGSQKDYKAARAMVNGTDQQDQIAFYAEVFEEALLASHTRWLGGGLRLRDEASKPARTREG